MHRRNSVFGSLHTKYTGFVFFCCGFLRRFQAGLVNGVFMDGGFLALSKRWICHRPQAVKRYELLIKNGVKCRCRALAGGLKILLGAQPGAAKQTACWSLTGVVSAPPASMSEPTDGWPEATLFLMKDWGFLGLFLNFVCWCSGLNKSHK